MNKSVSVVCQERVICNRWRGEMKMKDTLVEISPIWQCNSLIISVRLPLCALYLHLWVYIKSS